MAAGAVGANIGPAEWSVMLRGLIAACKQGGGCKIDASSSHSYYKREGVRMGVGKHRLDVDVDGICLMVSDMGVTCATHMLVDVVVKGCSLGDGGVWLRVEAVAASGFWLEIHVPMQTGKGGCAGV
jgi:hypothetical protein